MKNWIGSFERRRCEVFKRNAAILGCAHAWAGNVSWLHACPRAHISTLALSPGTTMVHDSRALLGSLGDPTRRLLLGVVDDPGIRKKHQNKFGPRMRKRVWLDHRTMVIHTGLASLQCWRQCLETHPPKSIGLGVGVKAANLVPDPRLRLRWIKSHEIRISGTSYPFPRDAQSSSNEILTLFRALFIPVSLSTARNGQICPSTPKRNVIWSFDFFGP